MDGKLVDNANQVLDDLEKQVGTEIPKPKHDGKVDSETVMGHVKESATKSVQALSDKAVELSQETREIIKEQVTSGREVLTSALNDAAKAVNQVSESDSPGLTSFRPYTERLGLMLDQTSQYLNTVTPQRLVKDTRTLARNNPAVFVGGALLVGLVAARFLKSTSSAEKDL